MNMPFGKYKGKRLDDILAQNPEYIIWLSDNCELKGALKEFCYDNYNEACEIAMEEQLKKKRNYFARYGGRVDFMGNYEDEDGYEDPNFGWTSWDEEEY